MADLRAALHAALVAALDATQHDADTAIYRATTFGDKIRRRVAADRRVLARHAVVFEVFCGWCIAPNAAYRDWPCPDTRDLAARYPTDAVRLAMLALGHDLDAVDV